MDAGDIARWFAGLATVVGLIGLAALGLRRFGASIGLAAPGGHARRLQVAETVALDPRRRLVLVRRDDTEHLILLGGERETVVESHIRAEADAAPRPETPDDAAPPGPGPGHIVRLLKDRS